MKMVFDKLVVLICLMALSAVATVAEAQSATDETGLAFGAYKESNLDLEVTE